MPLVSGPDLGRGHPCREPAPPQREQLVREGYLLGGVSEPAPSVMALTALGAALASCALLAMLSSEGRGLYLRYWIDGLDGRQR